MDAPADHGPIQVPFLALRHVNEPLKPVILSEISDLIDSGAFTNGRQVAAFEAAFAEYCGTRHGVGVASGLDGLRLALLAAGIERGDEVLVPAATFVATLEAVTQARGVPVLVDAAEDDLNLDPAAAHAAITSRTRFVLPVHLYGQMADMRTLQHIAARNDLRIVEDACQAHGAMRDGIRAGQAGLAGAFSFYPGKNLGAMGDAGAVVTDHGELASRILALREHGQSAKYRHDVEGYTSRLDTLQALVLLHKLPLLDGWNAERRLAAEFYTDALAGIGDLRLPGVAAGSQPVWHLYVVRTADPAGLGAFLSERGIGSGRHYPEPPHLSAAYAWLGHGQGSFPVAESLARTALSLPLFPGIAEEQLLAVVESVRTFFKRG